MLSVCQVSQVSRTWLAAEREPLVGPSGPAGVAKARETTELAAVMTVSGRPKPDGTSSKSMKLQVLAEAEAVAQEAARIIAAEARAAVAARGRFILAVSGGQTPWRMLRALAKQDVPWPSLHVFQVDERIAPAGDPDRNLTHLRASLAHSDPRGAGHLHAMPVEEPDLEAAAVHYSRTIAHIAGGPPGLDLVHLGLGSDGHTASLIPGDPVCEVRDRDVALTNAYQGRCRMTLTYPLLNRARRILWLVTGAGKADMLRRLRAGDHSIPAGRIRQEQALVLADQPAATALAVS